MRSEGCGVLLRSTIQRLADKLLLFENTSLRSWRYHTRSNMLCDEICRRHLRRITKFTRNIFVNRIPERSSWPIFVTLRGKRPSFITPTNALCTSTTKMTMYAVEDFAGIEKLNLSGRVSMFSIMNLSIVFSSQQENSENVNGIQSVPDIPTMCNSWTCHLSL